MQKPLSIAVLLAACGGSVLAAQSYPTSNPVVRQIWTEGMGNSQAYKLAQILSDSIGPRLTGSPGIKRGNDWLVATYKSWGVDARNEQYGKWKGWRRGTTHVDLMTPRVRTLEGTLLAWSAGTGGKDVTGTTRTGPANGSAAHHPGRPIHCLCPQRRGRDEPTARLRGWPRGAAPGR